jgi:uncharacterized protein
MNTALADIPSTDTDIHDLMHFLDDAVAHDGMDISTADGYMTAIASCPVAIPTEEWLPGIFGSRDVSSDDYARMHDIILRRFATVQRALEEDVLNPLFRRISKEDVGSAILREVEWIHVPNAWCMGYLKGVGLRSQVWSSLVDRPPKNGLLLTPIFAMALELVSASIDERDIPFGEPEREEDAEAVVQGAQEVYWYWQDHPVTETTRASRIGRNEPCLCGSGKKYKKCCAP